MISIPVAVHTSLFQWQLDLFWHAHKSIYGANAYKKAFAIIIKRNNLRHPKQEELAWDIDIPHAMCESFFDMYPDETNADGLYVPLNIQTGLQQIIHSFPDEQVIEVLDCDMLHLRRHPDIMVRDDELVVDDIYEPWHLKSLSSNRHVIDIYFENGGRFYNGGFVPIIGKVKTFKKLLPEWIAVHRHILRRNLPSSIKWWGGMFGLQAACEKKKVRMRAESYCYIPSINRLEDHHYIAHYSCDKKFDKKIYPRVDSSTFEDNLFYRTILGWPTFSRNHAGSQY